MNLNYAIFRSEPIYTLSDLSQIGAHNKREKKAYNSNPDIKKDLSYNNIELVPLQEKYVRGFYELTKEYKQEHEKRMETEREDRKRTYRQMLDSSKNCVADELLFTATNEFFKDMAREDIKKWADTCMEFVYKDLGYKKEQVLHATVHMDEKTPHIHCVVVPLIRKYDKRTNTERYTISKKQYIKDKIHLSELQDKYHKRLNDKGYDLERGIKHSDNEHVKIKDFKRITSKINHDINIRNDKLDKVMNEFEENMKTNKTTIFDKEYVKVKKETFDSMNNVINETKKVMELQPKLKQVFDEVNTYSKNYNQLNNENKNLKKEIDSLEEKNNELEKENNKLRTYISVILDRLKRFFRKVLKLDNEESKNIATTEIKDHYDNQVFDNKDIFDISHGTSKEDELFDYANIPDYYKSHEKSSHKKDDYEMSI